MAHIDYTTGKIRVKESYDEIVKTMRNHEGKAPFFLKVTETLGRLEKNIIINIANIVAIYDTPKEVVTNCEKEE